MDKLIDVALGVHPQALSLGARRLELLAQNMANADTPDYKARDIDFRAALSAALAEEPRSGRSATHTAHLPVEPGGTAAAARYRVPNQPALDGNTVDGDLEKAAFAEAAVRYQASVDFLSMRIDGLRRALRGE